MSAQNGKINLYGIKLKVPHYNRKGAYEVISVNQTSIGRAQPKIYSDGYHGESSRCLKSKSHPCANNSGYKMEKNLPPASNLSRFVNLFAEPHVMAMRNYYHSNIVSDCEVNERKKFEEFISEADRCNPCETSAERAETTRNEDSDNRVKRGANLIGRTTKKFHFGLASSFYCITLALVMSLVLLLVFLSTNGSKTFRTTGRGVDCNFDGSEITWTTRLKRSAEQLFSVEAQENCTEANRSKSMTGLEFGPSWEQTGPTWYNKLLNSLLGSVYTSNDSLDSQTFDLENIRKARESEIKPASTFKRVEAGYVNYKPQAKVIVVSGGGAEAGGVTSYAVHLQRHEQQPNLNALRSPQNATVLPRALAAVMSSAPNYNEKSVPQLHNNSLGLVNLENNGYIASTEEVGSIIQGNLNGSPSDKLHDTISNESHPVVDRIMGIKFTSLGKTKTQKNESNQSSQERTKKSTNYNDQSQQSQGSVKCFNNKFDRLIAQKISLNDLSRPIVKSDGTYDNPFSTWSQPKLFDVFKFFVIEPDDSNIPSNKDELDKELPILKPEFRVKETKQGNFRVTWLGHSTLLIQVDDYNILTDPIFSKRASPSQFFGPERFRAPACSVSSLPRVDVVVVSHNHYDHLDSGSVTELNDRFGTDLRWIVPLGLGEYLTSMSVKNYVELDWWQKDCFNVPISRSPGAMNKSTSNGTLSSQTKSNGTNNENSDKNGGIGNNETNGSPTTRSKRSSPSELSIYLTPSQHWSRRGLGDTNKSLWGSYTIVSSSGATFFFGGDTGYCTAFKEISKIFGPFTGAAIPIGAYHPRWFLRPAHVDPAQAVQIHRDLRSSKSIAIHHATFKLSNENYKEPAELLRSIMKELKDKEQFNEPFITLKHGESTEFPKAEK